MLLRPLAALIKGEQTLADERRNSLLENRLSDADTHNASKSKSQPDGMFLKAYVKVSLNLLCCI